jgi:hypothetical protein
MFILMNDTGKNKINVVDITQQQNSDFQVS